MERADPVLSEAVERGRAAGERGVAADAAVALADLRFHRPAQTGVGREDVLRELDAAIPVFEELGDEAGLARASVSPESSASGAARPPPRWRISSGRRGTPRNAGDRAQEAESLQYVIAAMHRGPMPVEEALERLEGCARAQRRTGRFEVALLEQRAQLEAMQGRFDAARDLTFAGESLGGGARPPSPARLAHGAPAAGFVELLARRCRGSGT